MASTPLRLSDYALKVYSPQLQQTLASNVSVGAASRNQTVNECIIDGGVTQQLTLRFLMILLYRRDVTSSADRDLQSLSSRCILFNYITSVVRRPVLSQEGDRGCARTISLKSNNK